jgi:hypothetical protein
MMRCWNSDAAKRPDFKTLLRELQVYAKNRRKTAHSSFFMTEDSVKMLEKNSSSSYIRDRPSSSSRYQQPTDAVVLSLDGQKIGVKNKDSSAKSLDDYVSSKSKKSERIQWMGIDSGIDENRRLEARKAEGCSKEGNEIGSEIKEVEGAKIEGGSSNQEILPNISINNDTKKWESIDSIEMSTDQCGIYFSDMSENLDTTGVNQESEKGTIKDTRTSAMSNLSVDSKFEEDGNDVPNRNNNNGEEPVYSPSVWVEVDDNRT